MYNTLLDMFTIQIHLYVLYITYVLYPNKDFRTTYKCN